MNSKRRYRIGILALILAFLLSAISYTVFGQTPSTSSAKPDTSRLSVTSTYAFGEVVAINPTQRQILINTKDGNVTASFDNKTQFLRVPPGAETLDKAAPIELADVGVGDTLMARGKVSDDKKTVLARQIVVMSKKAIEQKQEHDREEWRRRSLAGRVKAINTETKELTLMVVTPEGERPILMDASNKVIFRRYAPNSVKFDQALPSSFEELKPGDQLRTLGKRSQDGAHFTAEEIVSGSFRVLGGPIVSVNPATGEITINDIPTKKVVTIVINAGSTLRKIPDELVASLARRKTQASGQSAATNSGNNSGDGARSQSNGTDLLEVFDRLPPVTINDLKPGRMVLVSSTAGIDPSRVTAILLATGLDPLFIRPQAATGRTGSVVAVGLPSGIFDGYIGAP
jgi:hypothetical protein